MVEEMKRYHFIIPKGFSLYKNSSIIYQTHVNIRLCYNDNPFERRIPMAKRRRFTAKFKAEVVLEALGGESSQAELCRRHNLSEK